MQGFFIDVVINMMSGMLQYVLSESVKCPCSGSYLAYMQMNTEVCFPQLLSVGRYIP
jgi:hypothetical protein